MYSTINLLHDKIGELKEKKANLTEVREINILHVLRATTELQENNQLIDRLEKELKNLYDIQNPPTQMGSINGCAVGPGTDNPNCGTSETMRKTPGS